VSISLLELSLSEATVRLGLAGDWDFFFLSGVLLRDLLLDLSLFFSLDGLLLFLSLDLFRGDLDLLGGERLGLDRLGDRDLLRLLGEGDLRRGEGERLRGEGVRRLWTGDLRLGEGERFFGDLDLLLGLFDLRLGEGDLLLGESLRFLLLSGEGDLFFFLDFDLSFFLLSDSVEEALLRMFCLSFLFFFVKETFTSSSSDLSDIGEGSFTFFDFLDFFLSAFLAAGSGLDDELALPITLLLFKQPLKYSHLEEHPQLI